jgi:signal transduction histidine kinase
MRLLGDALHWGIMLGFETYVSDSSGKVVMSSSDMLADINPTMSRRMNSLFELPGGVGEFDWYPLYAEGREIGNLYLRPLKRRGEIPVKEEVFKARGRKFLVTSFLIAGGGAVLLAVIFARFLSAPLRRLTALAEKIAAGEGVRPPASKGVRPPDAVAAPPGGDEIERLTASFYFMAEALQKEDETRRRLTANVAHQLRTPLSIIRGSVEALEDGVISDPALALKNVGAEVARLTALVSGIEDMARAEAFFFKKGEPETIDLAEFVESIAAEMDKLFRDKGLFLSASGPNISVKTYPDKLRIILDNLLTNALKYTDAGGVTVSWGKSARVRDLHNGSGRYGSGRDGKGQDGRGKDGKGDYFIEVADTGRGMAPDELPRVFERFHKGAHSTGLGLGLAIAGELAGVIGAVLEVESIEGKGSRFVVRF